MSDVDPNEASTVPYDINSLGSFSLYEEYEKSPSKEADELDARDDEGDGESSIANRGQDSTANANDHINSSSNSNNNNNNNEGDDNAGRNDSPGSISNSNEQLITNSNETSNTVTLITESYQGSQASSVERQHNEVLDERYHESQDSVAPPPTKVLRQKRNMMISSSAPEASYSSSPAKRTKYSLPRTTSDITDDPELKAQIVEKKDEEGRVIVQKPPTRPVTFAGNLRSTLRRLTPAATSDRERPSDINIETTDARILMPPPIAEETLRKRMLATSSSSSMDSNVASGSSNSISGKNHDRGGSHLAAAPGSPTPIHISQSQVDACIALMPDLAPFRRPSSSNNNEEYPTSDPENDAFFEANWLRQSNRDKTEGEDEEQQLEGSREDISGSNREAEEQQTADTNSPIRIPTETTTAEKNDVQAAEQQEIDEGENSKGGGSKKGKKKTTTAAASRRTRTPTTGEQQKPSKSASTTRRITRAATQRSSPQQSKRSKGKGR
ncbi:hypothetical protein BDB00DRAFT_815554 [Zychaea mexicana]|uniref:uncharacterized protein n=1 Tax=Zychaea mexicana TaxID=64656 RepID=UPI0022FE4167|nr:uncharacterized protein BDB00DRAFT_815554 [Zychaea mexicana]KAI9495030.1 hypothetical protein BDB00DRAFT_815554 [Zychaea mexicana]